MVRSRPHECSTSSCSYVGAQNESRLRTMARRALYCWRRVNKQSHLLEGDLYLKQVAHIYIYIFENKPPTQSGPCLKKGGGAYFQEDTVIVCFTYSMSQIKVYAAYAYCQESIIRKEGRVSNSTIQLCKRVADN